MQGLFYSVTATFLTLVFALALFVLEEYQQIHPEDITDAYRAKTEANYLIDTFQRDVENMLPLRTVAEDVAYHTCRVTMTRSGNTRSFTFPTLRYPEGEGPPTVVQVTYELEGQAKQIQTRRGLHDVYRLRRTLDEGHPFPTLGGSTEYIVDFVVELFPNQNQFEASDLRILSGDCPEDLSQVHVEFQVALPRHADIQSRSTNYATTARYSATVHPRSQLAPSIIPAG